METFCGRCGTKHTKEAHPKSCANCNHITYVNPIPVVVVMAEIIGKGYCVIERNIEPGKGKWAFPGGYVDGGEHFMDAARRELLEETGIVYEGELDLIGVESSTNNANIMIFVRTKPFQLPSGFRFRKNSEVTQVAYVTEPDNKEFAFPSHKKYLDLCLLLLSTRHLLKQE